MRGEHDARAQEVRRGGLHRLVERRERQADLEVWPHLFVEFTLPLLAHDAGQRLDCLLRRIQNGMASHVGGLPCRAAALSALAASLILIALAAQKVVFVGREVFFLRGR
jgi:hypothetical protein